MTPTLLDLIVAAPRCMRWVVSYSKPDSRQHGVHGRCYREMCYRAVDNTWRCDCGNVIEGERLAAA